MEFTLSFLNIFFLSVGLALPLLLMFIVLICLLGLLVGALQKWSSFDAIYYAFITATTVGYGDFRPVKKLSRFLAILIAFLGVAFTGIFVSITVNAANIAFQQTQDVGKIKARLQQPGQPAVRALSETK